MDRQGIHIRPQPDRRTIAGSKNADHASLADVAVNLAAELGDPAVTILTIAASACGLRSLAPQRARFARSASRPAQGAAEKLIVAANTGWLHYSENFDDGLDLLKAADRMNLEGIVSKRSDAPYRAGKQCGWVKVKCATWREANKERRRLFERSRANDHYAFPPVQAREASWIPGDLFKLEGRRPTPPASGRDS